jgi:hypothetical protein
MKVFSRLEQQVVVHIDTVDIQDITFKNHPIIKTKNKTKR